MYAYIDIYTYLYCRSARSTSVWMPRGGGPSGRIIIIIIIVSSSSSSMIICISICYYDYYMYGYCYDYYVFM